jgi:hypothetical protein
MKKVFVGLVILMLVFSFSACTKKENSGFAMNSSEVARQVYSWKLYTNPAYRYELRFPNNWLVYDSGEDGKQAAFYPEERGVEVQKNNETYYGSLVILAHSNWQTKYTLEDFYRQATENLFLGNYQQEKVFVGGIEGVWFKDVRNRNFEKPEVLVDLVALDLGDRILEIEIHEKQYWDDIKTILNSMTFYPNASPSDMK